MLRVRADQLTPTSDKHLALEECRLPETGFWMPVAKRYERPMLHSSAPFTVGTPNCFCVACSASMTRPLSQRLCEHEDGWHAIIDPCLPTFAARSEFLSLWRFQDILAYGTTNRLAGDLADDAFLDTVRRTGQIQLTPSNKGPFLKKQPCIM